MAPQLCFPLSLGPQFYCDFGQIHAVLLEEGQCHTSESWTLGHLTPLVPDTSKKKRGRGMRTGSLSKEGALQRLCSGQRGSLWVNETWWP